MYECLIYMKVRNARILVLGKDQIMAAYTIVNKRITYVYYDHLICPSRITHNYL